MKKSILFIFLFLSLSGIGNAEKFQFRNFNNLFPSTKVYDILKDSKGYMWFGTYDGLIRYNAYDFVNFQNVPGDLTSLPINNIRSLKFDPEQETFNQIGLPAGFDKHLYINDIVEDHQQRIWIGSLDGLLIMQDSLLHQFKPANAPDQLRIRSLLVDQQNVVWVGTEGDGLYFIKDNKLQKFELPGNEIIPISFRCKAD